MKWTAFILIFLMLKAESAELKPFIKNDHLGLNITDMDLPPNLKRDLKSGLTNKFLILTTAKCEPNIKLESNLEIAMKYDLWEGSFSATLIQNQGEVKKMKYSSLLDILNYLGKIRLENIFPMKQVSSCKILTITSDILFDPISKEKLEKIKKWVNENSTPNPVGTGNTGNLSRSGRIFSQIFEQYANGESVGSFWKTQLLTEPFSPSELKYEK